MITLNNRPILEDVHDNLKPNIFKQQPNNTSLCAGLVFK